MFLAIWIENVRVSLKNVYMYKKNINIYIKFGPIWVGNIPGCVYNICFAVKPPGRGFFEKTILAKNVHFWNFGRGHFSKKKKSLRRKLDFLGHLFEEISHKSGSYGP